VAKVSLPRGVRLPAVKGSRTVTLTDGAGNSGKTIKSVRLKR
jgi:hypothetical protein